MITFFAVGVMSLLFGYLLAVMLGIPGMLGAFTVLGIALVTFYAFARISKRARRPARTTPVYSYGDDEEEDLS